MKYNSILVTLKEDSGSEPVTLAEAKGHLYITGTDHDTYLTFLIKACRQDIEGIYNISLVSKTVTAKIKNQLGNQDLLYPPIAGINSLVTLEGEEIAFDETNYLLDTCFDDGIIEYETEAVVNEAYKFRVLELIAYKFANRGDAAKPVNKGVWLV